MNSRMACLLLGLLAVVLASPVSSALAQSLSLNPSAEESDKPLQTPDPRSLAPGWWSYLGDAGDKLPERAAGLKNAIDTAVLSLSVADSSEAVAAAERAQREIDAYVQAAQRSSDYALPTFRSSGEFTLQDYLEIQSAIRALKTDIARERGQLDELRELVAIERSEVDQRLTVYIQGDPDGVRQLIQGLKIMGDRAALAFSRLRLDRRSQVLEGRRQELLARQQQALHARDHLVPGPWDPEQSEQRLQGLDDALVLAASAVEVAKDELLDQDETGADAALQGSHKRQRLLAAMIKVSELHLERGRNQAISAWHQLQSEGEDAELDGIETLILDLRSTATRVDDSFDSWQRTDDFLALVEAVPEGSRDRELRRLQERTRELGAENLRKIRDLEGRAAELRDLADVLTRAVTVYQGGVQGAIRRIALAFSGWWEQFGRLADTALFHLGDVPVTPVSIGQVILILIVALTLSALFQKGLNRIGHRRHLSDRSTLYLLGRVAHYLIIVIALLLGLSTLGFDFSSVALIAGALSVGIGFGLQSIVNNFVSGLVLMFDRSLKIGDYIELDSGVRGLVREINVRSTRVNTNDNFDVLVPNSELFSSKLTNWTHRDAMARFRIPFGVAYGSDKERVREAALEAASKVDYTLKNMPGREPEVWMTGFGDSSLDFELLVWVSRQGVRRPSRVKNAYLWELESAFQRYGVEIPFPQRDLHLRSDYRHPQPPDLQEAAEVPESDSASDTEAEQTRKE